MNIKQKELKSELNFACMVVKYKSSIPILSNVLLESDNNKLKIASTNLDLFLTSEIECEGEIKTAVNARDLKKIISVCGEDVELRLENNRLKIKSGKTEWALNTVDAEQFPPSPAFIFGQLEMPFQKWQEIINKVKFAACVEQSRFTLSGAKVLVGKKDLTLVATDGHRLAIAESNGINLKVGFEGLLRLEALNLFNKFKDKNSIKIGFSENYFHFAFGNRKLSVRELAGQFPNYQQVIPENPPLDVKFDVVAMAEVLRQSLAVKPRHPAIKWTLRDGVSAISAERDETSFQTELVTTYKGDELTFGVNPEYLVDLCKQLKTGVCKMELTDQHQQLLFEANEPAKERFRYVVMPQRV